MDKLHLLAKPGESLADVQARAKRLRGCVRLCEPCPECRDNPWGFPHGWIYDGARRCIDCEIGAENTELHELGYWDTPSGPGQMADSMFEDIPFDSDE